MRTYDVTYRVTLSKEDCLRIDAAEEAVEEILDDYVYRELESFDLDNVECVSIKEVSP